MSIPFRDGAVVVTSISAPNPVLRSLAEGALKTGAPFIVTGDTKSPADFALEGCDFYGIPRQAALPFAYAKICRERTYARKNVGYLIALSKGAQFIVETDDDNFPREGFWEPRDIRVSGRHVALPSSGWLNAYGYFSDTFCYPRGYPIEEIRGQMVSATPVAPTLREELSCPIQQGLADENPDVDALYRMLFPLPLSFRQDTPLILGAGTWCPFNSQNTTTFPAAYPLLYLPTHCSFRMTDIWRSFVAQRIVWETGGAISFHSSTVWQDRNEHNLLHDFADEIPGYLNNAKIAKALTDLDLGIGAQATPEALGEAMLRCYRQLIAMGLVGAEEIPLLEAWLKDLKDLRS